MRTLWGFMGGILLAGAVHANSPSLAPVVTEALLLVGTPYKYGGTGKTLDCSAFTQACYRGIGIQIPRTSREQFAYGKPVSLHQTRAGDLLFWRENRGSISHVGLYLGGGYVAHATSHYGRVVVEKVEAVHQRSRFAGTRRILEKPPVNRPERKATRLEIPKDRRPVRKAIWSRTRSYLNAVLRLGR
jgi:cell wall-associated NlpC family hydrolase